MIRVTELHHVNVVVREVGAARHFYGDFLGLSEIPVAGKPQRDVVWYQIGHMRLHVSYEAEPRNADPGRHVAFVVDDLYFARQEFLAAGYGVEDAHPLPGIDRLFIRDPDSNRVELISLSPGGVA